MITTPSVHKPFKAEYDKSAPLKLEWFGGNTNARDMCITIAAISQVWDDLIDKDEPVSDAQIHHAFTLALVHLPANPFYQQMQHLIRPMFIASFAEYKVSIGFERNKDEHGLEIAHGLRFKLGSIFTLSVVLCVGEEKAAEYLPEVWKFIMSERFDDYRKEHMLTGASK